MKSLIVYINEKIKDLPNSVKGLIVFDIDDTILKVDASSINIYKKVPGEKEIALTTAEFAKDPDASDPTKRSWFSYRDFQNPEKVYNSIISGTPIIRNLRIMDSYIAAGYDFCFLTARSCEDVIKRALDDFLRIRDRKTGALSRLGSIFNKTMSHAINDTEKQYKTAVQMIERNATVRQLEKAVKVKVSDEQQQKNHIKNKNPKPDKSNRSAQNKPCPPKNPHRRCKFGIWHTMICNSRRNTCKNAVCTKQANTHTQISQNQTADYRE